VHQTRLVNDSTIWSSVDIQLLLFCVMFTDKYLLADQ